MKLVLSIIVLFVSGALHSQILDTLRMDTCFNIAFNKPQVDYYYLKKDGRDIKLVRSTKIIGIAFPAIIRNTFYSTNSISKTDKTGKKKDGEKDTLTIKNADGSINYMFVRSFNYSEFFDQLLVSEKYIIPNGNNWFLDYHPNGKPFRAVVLDSSGKIMAEMSTNQVDSFDNSFIQMDKDSNIVVYQAKEGQTTPKVLSFCLYPSGVKAFDCIKTNDSTSVCIYYFLNGKPRIVSTAIITKRKAEDLSPAEKEMSIIEAWKTIEHRLYREYDEKGVIIKEE